MYPFVKVGRIFQLLFRESLEVAIGNWYLMASTVLVTKPGSVIFETLSVATLPNLIAARIQ